MSLCREWACLLADQPLPADADRGRVYHFYRQAAELWDVHGGEAVAHFVTAYPGERPSLWWTHSAPELRLRVGGTGDVLWKALRGYKPVHCFGLPRFWLTHDIIRTYAHLGIALDAVPVDTDDPPQFESEAAYLHRHGLLLPGESARLEVDAFEPESIPADFLSLA